MVGSFRTWLAVQCLRWSLRLDVKEVVRLVLVAVANLEDKPRA